MITRRTLPTLALLALFVALALSRLNPFCLFEPDSADYLFTARALATFEGYVEIDHPSRIPHAFRPPGLPLSLVPVAWLAPLNVVAAKLWIVGCAVALLLLLQRFAQRLTDRTTSIVVSIIVACSPYTLLHATEVVSEVPFLLLLFALLLVAGSDDAPTDGRRRILVAAMLGLLPLVRTVGFAFLAAFAVWAFVSKSRRKGLIPLAVALALNGLWWWRGATLESTTYLSGMIERLRELGPGPYAVEAGTQALFYLRSLAELALPGIFASEPIYERLLIDDAPRLAVAAPLGGLVAILLAALAIWGLIARRRAEGWLVGLYLLLFIGLLAIYPPRHARLAWPLVPLLWVYAGAGLFDVSRRLRSRLLVAGGGVVLAAVILLQLHASFAIVSTNLAWWRGGDSFYAQRHPPEYFSDWQRAGEAIDELAPRWARALTRHSDLGLTSQRFQDSLRFEEVSPRQLIGAVVRLPARYVVISSATFDLAAPAHLFHESPTFRYETVWQGRDVRVLEVRPNREGSGSIYPDDLEMRIEACRQAVERMPARGDLGRRLAELLKEARRYDEALSALDAVERRRGPDARSAVVRGAVLLEMGRADAAVAVFEEGSSLPGATFANESLRRGLARALRERELGNTETPGQRLRRTIEEASYFLDNGLLRSASIALERAATMAPSDPAVLLLQGRLDERSGNRARALTRLEPLRRAGVREAAELLDEWALEQRLLAADSTAAIASYLRLAARRMEEGLPGRSLALLERAYEAWSGSADVARALGLSWWFHGRPDRARPLLEAVLRERPQDREAAAALQACVQALAERQ